VSRWGRIAAVVVLAAWGAGCVAWPQVMDTPPPAGHPLPGIRTGAPAVPGPAGPGPTVRLLDATSSEYAALDLTGADRSVAGAPTRLVVFQQGRAVLDLGVRDEGAGRTEEAVVAQDGSAAAVVAVEVEPRVRIGPGGREERTAVASVTWIPAADPGAAWRLPLPPGRVVRSAVPLPRARGLVLATAETPSGAADFQVVAPGQAVMFRLDPLEGSVVEVRPTPDGSAVAADVAFASRPGLPDRGLRIHDLDRGLSWTYAWSYGTEAEPLAWTLADDGSLEVKTGRRTVRYDRTGRLLP
jgi:hypothetical protein